MSRWTGTGIIRNWFAQHRPRGAAVPFEAPALRMARVCDDEHSGLIAILRDFANNGTTYIVPWTSLPLVTAMTDHDKALHEAVGENKASTPAQVRAVVSRLALSGALGPEAQAREAARSDAERDRLAEVELLLMLHLLNTCGADLATLLADPVRWHQREAKTAVAAAAASVGVRRQDIYRRVGELARVLTPVGLATQSGMPAGWLRVLHDEIAAFAGSMAVTGSSRPPEIATLLADVAQSAGRIDELSGSVLAMLDYAVLDIAATIRRWDFELPVLRQSIDRLSLMLDEWPGLMKLARDTIRGPDQALCVQLRLLCSMLPRLPDAADDHARNEQGVSQSVSAVLGARLSAIRSMLGASCAVNA